MHDFKMSSPTLIPSPVCFIDGLARTGKRILCQLFPALDNMEHPHFFYLLEQILAMMEHNRISNDAARSLLTLQLNEFFCDYILSRKANFRPNELTSVFNARHPQKFFENLSKEDHPNNMREFSEGNTKYYSFQTHNLLTQFKTFKKLELPYKVISIFRDPIDTVWSWYERGWGTRFDSDSRAFTTLIQTNCNTKLPWWCLSINDLYSESSPMDRCILMHNILLRRAIESAKNLNWSKGVLILKFEDLCQDPDIALRKISQFLGLSIGFKLFNLL